MARKDLPKHLPKIIKGPIVDTVVLRKPKGFDPEDSETTGYYDPGLENPELTVQAGLPVWNMWHTFFHELLHKIEADSDLELVENEDLDPTNLYDRFATTLMIIWMMNGWKFPGEK